MRGTVRACLDATLLVALTTGAALAGDVRDSSVIDGMRPPVTEWTTAVCPQELTGAWRGELPVAPLFDARLTLVRSADGKLRATISTQAGTESVVAWMDGPHVRFQSRTSPLSFRGAISPDGGRVEGFVQQGSSIVRIALEEAPLDDGASWTTEWTPLTIGDDRLSFDLYVEEDGEGGVGGYFFFRDQRLPGLWGYGLRCEGDSILLGERMLGLEFRGLFDRSRDRLVMDVDGPAGSTSMTFERLSPDQIPPVPDAPEAPPAQYGDDGWREFEPLDRNDGWPTATPSSTGMDPAILADLIAAVAGGELEYTHGILIARGGKLILEEYFYGFDGSTRHDMRSASKSVTSTLVGLAVQEGRIDGPRAAVLPYFPHYRRYDNWDDRKADITIAHLLTMSSGLDARDWEPESVASESAYQSQTEQPDWVKFALDAPMLWDPGAHVYYGGANPLILGGVLANVVDEPVEWFAHRTLFGPLGIDDYRFFLDPTGVPYMGGGMYMRPRDMLKYGQLYLNGGTWQGRRILAEEWIDESFEKYGRLEPVDRNGQQYGFLWWHHQYRVGDRLIESIEARGNGGQYIFIVPSLELVTVITSGNYRNGRLRQPEEIMRQWILPAAGPTGMGVE